MLQQQELINHFTVRVSDDLQGAEAKSKESSWVCYAPCSKERETWSSSFELLGSLHGIQGSSDGSSLPKTAPTAEALPSEAPNQNPQNVCPSTLSFPWELGAWI